MKSGDAIRAQLDRLSAAPASKADTMDRKFYDWLCETLKDDLKKAEIRLARVIGLREEAEKVRASASQAQQEAILKFDPFVNEQTSPAVIGFNAASRDWMKSVSNETDARTYVRDCQLRLDRASSGIAAAQAMIADTWRNRKVVCFTIDELTPRIVSDDEGKPDKFDRLNVRVSFQRNSRARSLWADGPGGA